jgi:hypothetical protein
VRSAAIQVRVTEFVQGSYESELCVKEMFMCDLLGCNIV